MAGVCGVLACLPTWAGGSKPQITFRIHVEQGGGGASQTIQVALTNPDQFVTIGRFAELSENHVQSVLPTPDGGMLVAFNSTGARILENVTSTQMGRIMVVFLNGRAVYAPVIDLPIRSGKLLVPGPLLPEDVAALQQLLARRAKKG